MTKTETPSIDAWSNAAITDYDHVFKEFGLKPFSKTVAKETGHYLFERGIVIAHRDFEKVAERISKKQPFINMTGFASSGPFHLGHKLDIDLFLYIKKNGARNYFALADIDGYISRPDAK
ncbi:MAG: hypothetical protein Q7R47_00905, partial [Candidatus Diapherotrites archaeon]|nr:hypothetical protein [Candidatus Diapherotrites archaeon]